MNLTWDGIIGGGVGTIAVGMACWALTVAKGQLTAMVGQTAAMLQQTKVNTLLTLAERWGSEPLLSIRADLFKLLEEVLEVAKTRWAQLAKEERRAHVENEFRTRLVQIRQQSPEQFQRLFEVCGFLETVGYLAKQNHLPVEETTGLFGVGIDQAALVFGSWIKQMHSEVGIRLCTSVSSGWPRMPRLDLRRTDTHCGPLARDQELRGLLETASPAAGRNPLDRLCAIGLTCTS